MAKHWKHTATRCAMPSCERARVKGWTTCALLTHYERGVSLYGLRSGPRLREMPAGTLDSAEGAR